MGARRWPVPGLFFTLKDDKHQALLAADAALRGFSSWSCSRPVCLRLLWEHKSPFRIFAMTPCLAGSSSVSRPAHFPGEGHHQTQTVMFLPGQDPVSPLNGAFRAPSLWVLAVLLCPVGWGSHDKGPCWTSGWLVIANVPLSDR